MCRDVTGHSKLLGPGRILPGKFYNLLASIFKADAFQMRPIKLEWKWHFEILELTDR